MSFVVSFGGDWVPERQRVWPPDLVGFPVIGVCSHERRTLDRLGHKVQDTLKP